MVYAGRWLTPPFGPVRFDNRFFLVEWPRGAAVQPEVVPGELAEGEWLEPGEAVERWRRGDPMPVGAMAGSLAEYVKYRVQALAGRAPSIHGEVSSLASHREEPYADGGSDATRRMG